MNLSFSSLGCPDWNLADICARGHDYGFTGVDFRGYLHDLDITLLPEFTTGITSTRRHLLDAGLVVSGISSSITICVPEKLAIDLEEARRTIEVAKTLECTNVRIYGGGDLSTYSRNELIKIGCENFDKIMQLDGANSLQWLFETHDNWIKAQDCRLILKNITNPAFGALWDMGHTYRVCSDDPQTTIRALQGRIGYTHIKDAIYDPSHPQAMPDGWRYVFPGTGSLPLLDSLQLLHATGYSGWLVFEHEKRWHPTLPEPELIFPAFISWMNSIAPLLT